MFFRILIVLLLFLAAPTSLLGQPPKQETPYTPLSQAELERIRSLPRSPESVKKSKGSFLRIERAKRNRNNSSITAIAGLFNASSSGEFMKFLELTPEQEPEIRELHEKFLADLESIDSETTEGSVTSARRKLQLEFLVALEKVLLTHQMDALSDLDIRRMGPVKVAVNPVIAGTLGLSERQKEKIKKRSDEIALEIFEFAHKKRQEALDVLQDELSEEQFEKLESIYDTDGKAIDVFLRAAPMRTLYSYLQFTRREGEDTDRHALEYMIESELKRKSKRKK